MEAGRGAFHLTTFYESRGVDFRTSPMIEMPPRADTAGDFLGGRSASAMRHLQTFAPGFCKAKLIDLKGSDSVHGFLNFARFTRRPLDKIDTGKLSRYRYRNPLSFIDHALG
jgi:hypothetical protein